MKALEIRAGTPSDAEAVAALINHEIRTGLAIWRTAERPESDIKAMLTERLEAGHGVYIAVTRDGVAGWAGYGPFRAGEGYGGTMEHSIHVNPDYRRRGVARALMSRLLDHADQAGVHTLIGAIEASNEASIALHRNFGFIETGRLPEVGRKFDRWLTLVLMQRLKQP